MKYFDELVQGEKFKLEENDITVLMKIEQLHDTAPNAVSLWNGESYLFSQVLEVYPVVE